MMKIAGNEFLFLFVLTGILLILLLFGSGSSFSPCPGQVLRTDAGAVLPEPVSKAPLPPPGVMPVVILKGSPYEMGYQYALQVPEYIAIVRDAAWASALTHTSYSEIINKTSVSREYISKELPDFDFISFFSGMSDGMNDQGIPFLCIDPLIILNFGARQGTGPEEHCALFAASDSGINNSTIAGDNFDYYQVPANSYAVLLALYPDNGYASIAPAGVGRLGSNGIINEKGLVYMLTSAPSDDEGDTGPGISGFLELPYVGMTTGSVSEAESVLLKITRQFSLNRLLVDATGKMEVIEATRKRYTIRYPDFSNGNQYIIITNHYLDPVMKPSQIPWDPGKYYPSSYFRYLTIEKIIQEHDRMINYSVSQEILRSCDWWDGRQWHMNDPYSSNTVNRFRPDVATLYSFIAVPDKHLASICQGNPDISQWGTKAPGQTGTYVNITIEKTPEYLVYQLRSDADMSMWNSVPHQNSTAIHDSSDDWSSIQERYWDGVWWHNKGILESDQNLKMVALGKAASNFSYVIAHAERFY